MSLFRSRRDEPRQQPAPVNQDPRAAERRAILDWLIRNASNPSDELMAYIANFFDEWRIQAHHMTLRVSSDSTKSGRAAYGITSLGEFHIFELNAEQERQLDIERGVVAIQPGGAGHDVDIRRIPPDVRIKDLCINDGKRVRSDAPVSVAVTCDAGSLLPTNAQLRVYYAAAGRSTSFASEGYAKIPPDRVLRAQLQPFASYGFHEGPVPMVVDLILRPQAEAGDTIETIISKGQAPSTIISNTLSALVDAVRPSPSESSAGSPTNTPR